MIGRWTSWKRFPNAFQGESLEAPIGPGVYEVCHIDTGEQVAFGSALNVAEALSKILPQQDVRKWPFFRRNSRPRYNSTELEYRTCAAGSLMEGTFRTVIAEASKTLGQPLVMENRCGGVSRTAGSEIEA